MKTKTNKKSKTNNKTKMNKKTKISILMISITLLLTLGVTIAIILYFYAGNISSKVPEELLANYNVKEETFQNRSVFVIKPKEEQTNSKTIFYLHGGSYLAELNESHWEFFQNIIQDTGATIIIPDYPLAPQYQYTDVFDMIFPLYQEIIQKVEQENLILMGDSAGGGMALALLEKAGEESLEQPSQTIVISPWLDVTMTNPEIEQVQPNDLMLNQDLLRFAGIAYAGSEEETKNYLVSPIYGLLENLGDIVIYTGTNDILNPDVHKLEELASKSTGTSIIVKETEGAVHDWILNRYLMPQYDNELADNAYQDLITEINDSEQKDNG